MTWNGTGARDRRSRAGAVSVSVSASGSGSQAVVFDEPFDATPIVVANCTNSVYYAAITARSSTGFTVTVRHFDNTSLTNTVGVLWQAELPTQ